MTALYAFLVVSALLAAGWLAGTADATRAVAGVYLPMAAMLVFIVGLAARVIRWAATPVPFRIPTTTGQQRTLGWIKPNRLDNPFTALGVVGRMALEVLLFRSLFRNTRAELRGDRLVHGEAKFLWLGALAFHWSFLIILLRHLRFFLEPVPGFVTGLAAVDGFFRVATPTLYVTDVVILVALGYLLARRFLEAQVRYVSLFSDYFALFLLIGLAGTGIVMRYFLREDVVAVKQLALGLVTFAPVVPATVSAFFFAHVTLLSALIAYFPFSKLMHAPGVFLSPTRNLANNNRAVRHVNPWNYPVKVHTYEEWEDEFRDKIKAAGLPLERAEIHG